MGNLNMHQPPSNTNTKYHLHIDLDNVYAPLQKRRGGNNISETLKAQLREGGAKHVDLWCDGSLYPKDPCTLSTPPFSNPTSLLRFIGDGKNGLLGYCKAISAMSTMEREMTEMKSRTINNLKMECKI